MASAPLDTGLTVSFHQVSRAGVGTRRQTGWMAAAADLNQPLPLAVLRQAPGNATWFAVYVSGWYSHTGGGCMLVDETESRQGHPARRS